VDDREVLVTDVLLRDGLQSEPEALPVATRIDLARALIAAGVRSLEVGAFVAPARVPQMAGTEAVLRGLADVRGVALHTLVLNLRGAERAVEAGARHVRLVVSASEGHSRANAGASSGAALERLEAAAVLLQREGVDVEACIATAFVCPFDGPTPPKRVTAVARRLEAAGVGVVALADTLGDSSPGQVTATLTAVAEACPDLTFALHLHNTYGMASANAMVALDHGVRRFDAALGGLGGCPFAPGAAGNVATDDLVHLLHRQGFRTGIDPGRLVHARAAVREAVGHPLGSALAAAAAAPAAAAA
jgi:hydroxymethylglutaryl-CoA lyase